MAENDVAKIETPVTPAVTPSATEPAKTEPVVAPNAPVKTPDAPKDSPITPKAEKVVPEKYDLKLPEKALLDTTHLEKIASFAKERGLSNEEAQTLVERENGAVSSFQEGLIAKQKALADTWVNAAKTDKEIGGEAFTKNVELAHRAIDRFATPELKKELDATGLGNHPELVRMFVRVGKSMSEDQFFKADSQTSGKKSAAETLYGDTK